MIGIKNGKTNVSETERTFNEHPNSFSKITFDQKTRLTGLGVLLKSRLNFTVVEDGFVIETKYINLLKKAKVSFESVEI